MVSIKDIAKAANVSPGTASHVLNGRGNELRISAKTQQRVLEMAKAMNYSPNISARRLRSGLDPAVPVISLFWTQDTRSSLIGRFLKGIQENSTHVESPFELLIQPYIGSKLREVQSLQAGSRFSGVIIANATEADQEYLEETDFKIPIVLYQRKSPKYCSVNIDDYNNGSEAAKLFAARGHKYASVIVPNVSSSAIHLRVSGFVKTAVEYGLTISGDYIVKGEFSEKGGYESAKQLMRLETKPDCVFLASDQLAPGVLLACREEGIQIPDELEIIGHDNAELSKYMNPSLTTIDMPVEEMAGASVNLLLDLLHHRISAPFSKAFTSELVIKETCGGYN